MMMMIIIIIVIVIVIMIIIFCPNPALNSYSPGLISHFGLDPADCHSFFRLVESGYHAANPYHTALHAADVTQVSRYHSFRNSIPVTVNTDTKIPQVQYSSNT